MKKIKKRAFFALIIAFSLVVGMAIWVIRLWENGSDWVMLRANQSVFNEGILDVGTVKDRNGLVLAKAGEGVFSYAEDESVRRACLHAVGDYAGNFGSGALSAFDYKLAGYDFINGVSSFKEEGASLRLSIDADFNTVAYDALAGRRGTVLLSNYKTGEILCMVSSPSYDPNNPPDVSLPQYEGVYLNRALGATFAPGSVFKLVTLAAAIENMPDLNERRFYCEGSVNVGGDTVTCTGHHGEQTIEQALANSCNVAFSELSQELGSEVLAEYAEKYGFIDGLSIDGIETAKGRFDKAERGTSDLSWSGIGQYNDLVSPISMLRYVSAIANGGVAKEPTLLKNGKSGKSSLMSSETAEKVSQMMSYNVSYAYGNSLFPDMSICAKTGTAEVGGESPHAWFAGFLDDDKNPYAFVVLVENGGGGLSAAAPVASRLLQAALG
ncbi:MAG: penicillin-binding protein 2 [Clostridiales bacterium]|nr:penicillin-binding protein 2 [Clostridiales bacterium]